MDAASETGPAGYRGRDRRTGARAVALRGRQLMTWGCAAFAGVFLLSAAVLHVDGRFADQLWVLALALWCTLGFGAGVALLVAWRVGGWATPARVGTALLGAAVLVSLVPRLSSAVGVQAQVAAARPVVLAAILLAAGVQCGRALDGLAVDTTLQPVRELGLLIALTLAGLLSGQAVLSVGPLRDAEAVRLLPAAACVLSAAWVALAARRERGAAVGALSACWALLAVGFVAHSVTASSVAAAVAVTTAATSAVLLAVVAAGYVKAALTVHDLRSLRTLAALAEHSDAAQREHERRHDALNALAAIRSASDVLASSAGGLDPATRAELVQAARDELDRVERMLAPAARQGVPGVQAAAHGVPLEDALRTVLTAWRQRGMRVEARLEGAVVHAPPDVVCRIVDNLLQNVHRHALGASVRLSVERGPGVVHLDVADDGPGLPAQRRGSSTGQGVGLTSSRRLARDLGGDLLLAPQPGRGCRVRVSLPAAWTSGTPALSRRAG